MAHEEGDYKNPREKVETRFDSFTLEQIGAQILTLRERLLEPGLDSIQVEPLVNSLEALRTELAVRKENLDIDDPDMDQLENLGTDIDLTLESFAHRAIMGDDAVSHTELEK